MVELTGDVSKGQSTLKADIGHFVKVVTIFALCQAVLVFVVGLAPGLPTTVTACLFIASTT